MLNNHNPHPPRPPPRDRACAACKHQRKKCLSTCIFAPYFPVRLAKEFGRAQKVFGASNMAKMASKIPVHQRGLFFESVIFESEERYRDPLMGCAGTLSKLRRENEMLRERLRLYENFHHNCGGNCSINQRRHSNNYANLHENGLYALGMGLNDGNNNGRGF